MFDIVLGGRDAKVGLGEWDARVLSDGILGYLPRVSHASSPASRVRRIIEDAFGVSPPPPG